MSTAVGKMVAARQAELAAEYDGINRAQAERMREAV